MSPEERTRLVCDAGWDDDATLYPLVLQAIREAVLEEREAIVRMILPNSRLIGSLDVLESLAAAIRARSTP